MLLIIEPFMPKIKRFVKLRNRFDIGVRCVVYCCKQLLKAIFLFIIAVFNIFCAVSLPYQSDYTIVELNLLKKTL